MFKLISNISNFPTFGIHSQQECKNTGTHHENKIMPHHEGKGLDTSVALHKRKHSEIWMFTLHRVSTAIHSAGLGFKPICLLMRNMALHTSYGTKHCIPTFSGWPQVCLNFPYHTASAFCCIMVETKLQYQLFENHFTM